MNLPKHLGGHINKTHIDTGLFEYLKEKYNLKSFLDVGCGPGGMVELAYQNGLKTLGIDGDYTIKRFDNSKFIIHDYEKGPLKLNDTYDLCWSCEFVEHVYEKYVDNFMQTMTAANIIIITYAPPGVPGHHHVNCRPADYWIDVFVKYNLIYDQKMTEVIRQVSTMKKQFIKKTGLFFVNKNI